MHAARGQPLASLARREHTRTQLLDESAGALDELRIRREHALLEIEIVLEPDAHVAAEQHGLRHHRQLHSTDPERRPQRTRRQRIAQGEHGLAARGGSVLDAEAELKERRALDEPLAQQLLGELDVAELEYLDLRADARLAIQACHAAQEARRRAGESLV